MSSVEEVAEKATEETYVSPQTLIASSKQKFMLAQARMHREMRELVLLSLQGALTDAFRSYLALRNHAAAQAPFAVVLDVLLEDSNNPLQHDECEQIRRMQKVQQRIATGGAVTLATDTIVAYQQLVALLMARYGVLVVIPELVVPLPLELSSQSLSQSSSQSLSQSSSQSSLQPQQPTDLLAEQKQAIPDIVQSLWHIWDKYRVHLAPLVGILLLFTLGAAAIIIVQQSRLAMDSPVPPIPTATSSPTLGPFQDLSDDSPISTPTVPSGEDDDLPFPVPVSNTMAYVSAAVGDGLALRTQPGTSEDTSVIIYLNPGTAVELVDGPVEIDGFAWWKVRAANKEGWCAGEFLEFE